MIAILLRLRRTVERREFFAPHEDAGFAGGRVDLQQLTAVQVSEMLAVG
jgi:hypothetical protein